ncbi:MAG: IS30 family transposase [Rubritalea sp.]|uniref:IS30 family transposase n=1 Tax=Rubritalea sp. TaxID=2109375 RepID=UPI003242C5E4
MTIKKLKDDREETPTYDNGLGFAGHERVSKKLEAASYFCAPCASWEKGGVKNFNGIVRQYYPNGSSFEAITEKDLKFVISELNTRPRKILDSMTPSEFNQRIQRSLNLLEKNL